MKRLLDPESLRALARGCAVLGAGGGGDPYLGLLQALQATEDFGPVPLMDLDELPDDSLIMPCGGIGAPTVSVGEDPRTGTNGGRLREHLEFLTGRRVAALMAAEIGGSNGLLPICWAARMGLPVADADGMGRAFLEVPQVTGMHLARASPEPGRDDRRARQPGPVPGDLRSLDGTPESERRPSSSAGPPRPPSSR